MKVVGEIVEVTVKRYAIEVEGDTRLHARDSLIRLARNADTLGRTIESIHNRHLVAMHEGVSLEQLLEERLELKEDPFA